MSSLLTLLHSERPKLYTVLAFLSAIGLRDALFGSVLFFSKSIIFIIGLLTLLHSEKPKLYGVLAFLSAVELSGKGKAFPSYSSKKVHGLIKKDGYSYRVRISFLFSLPQLSLEPFLKGKNLEQVLLRVNSFSEGFIVQGSKQEVTTVVFLSVFYFPQQTAVKT